MTLIQHLEDIKKIRTIEEEVNKEVHNSVFDISGWNSGEQYKSEMMQNYFIQAQNNIQDYRYSYEIDKKFKKSIMDRIGFDASKECVIFPSSTSAICCICDYIKKHNFNKICILEPSYFSISACLSSFGLSFTREYIQISKNGKPIIPYDTIVNNYDVLWVTSPIFSTGIYYDDYNISQLLQLAKKGIFIIIDESISAPYKYIGNIFQKHSNVVSIISPSKYLSINSQKFCAVICNSLIQNYLFDWIDVFCGSLPNSSFIAIQHFLSDNYKKCISVHDEYVKKSISIIKELAYQYPSNYFFGKDSSYITIQNKKQKYFSTIDYTFFYNLIKKTNASVIPGYINNFSASWGFCYRINLTLNHSDIQSYLGRVFNYFD